MHVHFFMHFHMPTPTGQRTHGFYNIRHWLNLLAVTIQNQNQAIEPMKVTISAKNWLVSFFLLYSDLLLLQPPSNRDDIF